MWIQTVNADLDDFGWFNIDRIDRVQIVGPYQENYVELKLTQGTTSVTLYINQTELGQLMLYLRSFSTQYRD